MKDHSTISIYRLKCHGQCILSLAEVSQMEKFNGNLRHVLYNLQAIHQFLSEENTQP